MNSREGIEHIELTGQKESRQLACEGRHGDEQVLAGATANGLEVMA